MVHWESYIMTVQDPVQHTSLILPSPPSLYHANIPDRHWQLRSLLCSPESNVLYYPTGRNIYSLNTKTRKRELVASLPFSPTCIGVKYGWLCAGGKDQGYFASIKVGESILQTYPAVESVGMGIASVEEMLKAEVKLSELGGLIVNSITLHKPPASKSGGDDVLAILTNNDKTVRVFSLALNRVQATLHLPISTNHASISPDGKHLVVVGDSTKVYFYHSSMGASAQYEAGREPWTLTRQLIAGTSDALISTAFSPSSVLCAVASQDGSITIFDTRFLSLSPDDGPSPIVKHIQSTRPRTHAGAIRSIQFSPSPWDLLVWAEHSGKVTVADVRSDFIERQVIDVLGNDENIVDVDISGVSDHDPPSECRDQQTRRSDVSEQGETEEDAPTGDELEGDLHGPLYNTSHGWISNPTATTTALHATESPPPSGHMHPRYYMRNTPSATFSPYVLTRSPAHITISTNDTSSNSQTGTQPVPPASNVLRDHRERRPERNNSMQQSREQLHRQSLTDHVAIPPDGQSQHGTQMSHDAHSSNITIDISNAAPNRPVHWRIDYEAQRRSAEEINQLQRNNEQLTQMIEEERRRNILRRTLLVAGANRRSDIGDHPANGRIEAGRYQSGDCVDITGCTMSVDGSKLYIATNKGIVEYKVDLMRRRYFPSLKAR